MELIKGHYQKIVGMIQLDGMKGNQPLHPYLLHSRPKIRQVAMDQEAEPAHQMRP